MPPTPEIRSWWWELCFNITAASAIIVPSQIAMPRIWTLATHAGGSGSGDPKAKIQQFPKQQSSNPRRFSNDPASDWLFCYVETRGGLTNLDRIFPAYCTSGEDDVCSGEMMPWK
jgi:hypothetical protein